MQKGCLIVLKRIKPGDIPAIIGKSAIIGIGNACGEPQTIVDVLFEQRDFFDSLEIYGMIFFRSQRLFDCYPENQFRLKTFMVDRHTVDGIKKGYVEYIPCRYSQIPGLFHNGHLPLDVALISVSPPNSGANSSFGVSSDFTMAMAKNAKTVIAEVNQQMPWVYGKSRIHRNEIDYLFESDRPLPQVMPAKLREVERKIAGYVAELVDDGATIQIGIGRLSEGILNCLYDKKHLGFHSGLITDGLVELVERGVVDNSCKGLKNGKIVTTTMIGTDKLFHFVNKNRCVESYPSDYTHNQVTLAKINRLHAINSAIQVDLLKEFKLAGLADKQISFVGQPCQKAVNLSL